MLTRVITVLLVGVIFAGPSWMEANDTARARRMQRYRELVETLVSANAKPEIHEAARTSVRFPAEYDANAQKRVENARELLHEFAEEALPVLTDSLEDKRYSMTCSAAGGDSFTNCSVGMVCRDIIACHLDVYRPHMNPRRQGHWCHSGSLRVITKDWWKARKDRSLVELQIEATEGAIKKCRDELMSERGQSSDAEITRLESFRDELRDSGKSAKPLNLRRMVTTNQ
jgi:hypothetical protein